MKIAMVTGSFPPQPCGIGDYTERLVAELRRHEMEIDVITTWAGQPRPAGSTQREVQDWKLSTWKRAVGEMCGQGYDLVHIQYPARFYGYRPDLALLSLIVKRGMPGIPIVATFHEYIVTHWLRKLTVGAIAAPLDAVILTADSERVVIEKTMPWLRRRIRVVQMANTIPTIVLLADQRETLRAAWGMAPGEMAIVHFGFVHPNKGVERLFESFAAFHARHPGARLVMLSLLEVETNPFHAYVRDLAVSLGINRAIVWKGFLPGEEVAQHLAAADIGLFPYQDGVTLRRLSFLSAMSHGLPVISTTGHAGDRSIGLLDGVNVSLLPAESRPDLFAARLEDLAGDKTKRMSMGTAARAWAAPFQWDSVIGALREVYNAVLQGKRK